ncbi:hypothetical protein KFK09_003868 [Dendrobium nobile]|uniref:beta-galactosidase n=1 Tax=Dendrobium nobile TaxID=94219 RepID=A0A8T3C474_DENNO|nr:hypothetical protein KFK09_003868 [Dendrobium nobile]
MLGFRAPQRLPFIVATALLAAVASVAVVGGFFEPFNVTYDHRALIIGGKRRMLISAGVHYPRATPEMWPGIILKCKEGGADVIQTYVFWNGHEPVRGQYYFEGRYDLVKFVKLVGSSGLYFHLRIGPYACAEWNFGGFPVWLRDITGIEFRTNNGLFKIDTCNGFYCDAFKPNAYKKPKIWTEDWNGWYASWGGRLPHRPVEDNAFAVARFFQRGGSYNNYYMFFGGTNFARTAGGPFQITSYDYDAPIDDYGLLISSFAHVYSNVPVKMNERLPKNLSVCSAFLANIDEHKSVAVKFFGNDYTLLPWSVIILPDCKNLAFNTAQVRFRAYFTIFKVQINVSGEDITYWKEKGSHPALTIHSIRDVARIFLNGQLVGGTYGNWVKLEQTLQLVQGCNELALLSETIGLKNYGAFIEKDGAGFRGPIKLTGFKDGEIELSSFPWTYQVGLKGEFVKIFAPEETEKVDWTILQPDKMKTPFTWYKTYFDIPEGKFTIALDLGSMGKGHAWVNGHGLGRYWSLVAPKYGCPGTCNYRGAYNENKCLTNCGKPTQTLYHIPRAWLQASNNLLVIFEETGGDPLEIKLKKHATVTICSQVSETHYPPLSSWHNPERFTGNISFDKSQPEMHLHCDDGYAISSITFASFGTPHGSCQHFSKGKCHAQNSSFVISEVCLGRNSCYVTVSVQTFSPDPCRGTVKTLAVQAECSPPSDYSLRSSF